MNGDLLVYSPATESAVRHVHVTGASINAYLLGSTSGSQELLADPGDVLELRGAQLQRVDAAGAAVPVADDHEVGSDGTVLEHKVAPFASASSGTGDVVFASGTHIERCQNAVGVSIF